MSTKKSLICALCCCLGASLGVASLSGCVTDVQGTSQNDKTAAFHENDEDTFSPASIEEVSEKTGKAVAITEQGYNAKDSYVHWGIMVNNPNTDLIARNTTVTVTLYDKAGNKMCSADSVIDFIGPDTTIGFAGNKVGDGTKPDKVDITVDSSSTIWQDADSYVEPFTIDDFTEKDAMYYRYQINGEITNHTGTYASTVPLSFIIRDDNSKIVGGYVGKAYRIKSGRTKSFKVTINTVPDHKTLEIYPQIYVEGKAVTTSNSDYN